MTDNSEFDFGVQCQCCGTPFHSNEELLDHIDYFQDVAAYHQAAAERARMHIISRRENGTKVRERLQNSANEEDGEDGVDSSEDDDDDDDNDDDRDCDDNGGDDNGDDDRDNEKKRSVKKLQCPKCTAKPTTRQNAQRHFQQHVRTYAICPQCLDPFVWANQYLSHKCIRKMKDPKIDFQACRIMRKVRRQWEKLQSKRLPPPTTGRHFAKKKRCAAEMQPRTPTHRKRQRARPAATQNESDNDNNSAPRASDAYQRPDDILVAGKETDYRQIAPGLLSASNEPDDEGMWFRGNMFLRPQFEPGPWFSGNIGTESLGQQEPCSQYLSRSSTIPGHGGTIPQELSHHWQPPVAPPKTAGMISEHSSSRWGQPGQYLGDARTTSGNGAWQATFPVNGPHPADT